MRTPKLPHPICCCAFHWSESIILTLGLSLNHKGIIMTLWGTPKGIILILWGFLWLQGIILTLWGIPEPQGHHPDAVMHLWSWEHHPTL